MNTPSAFCLIPRRLATLFSSITLSLLGSSLRWTTSAALRSLEVYALCFDFFRGLGWGVCTGTKLPALGRHQCTYHIPNRHHPVPENPTRTPREPHESLREGLGRIGMPAKTKAGAGAQQPPGASCLAGGQRSAPDYSPSTAFARRAPPMVAPSKSPTNPPVVTRPSHDLVDPATCRIGTEWQVDRGFFHERHGLMEGHGRRAAGGRPTS